MNIELIKTYEQDLKELGIAQSDTARAYLKARRRFANAKNLIWSELARDIIRYRKEKSNLGLEMALLTKQAEAQNQSNDNLLKAFDDYEISLAEYKGLEKALEALQSKAIGLQSIMKYTLTGEVYGGDNNGI
jgi:hypothetical protein